MRRLAPLALLALISGVSCSDRAFVGNAAAARLYWEDRYERECVLKSGPADCGSVYDALRLLEHHDPAGCDVAQPGCKPVGLIPTAQAVQKLGKLPREAKTEIKKALKKVKLAESR